VAFLALRGRGAVDKVMKMPEPSKREMEDGIACAKAGMCGQDQK
jgi:hypothetical protein